MPETKVRTQVQQQPVQILQGPKHRDDGYQIREEWGLPMNDAAYDEAKGIEQDALDDANEYKDTATGKLNEAVSGARGDLRRVQGPTPPQKPAETVIWAAGDGDPGQKYTFPSEVVPQILQVFKDTDYYKVVQHSDGSYGVAFKEYGKEGYDALNEAQSTYQGALDSAWGEYETSLSLFNRAIGEQRAAIDTAERGGRNQINQQYTYLTGIFGEEMAANALDWQKKRANNSQAVQALIAGGVLAEKKVQVI